MLYNSERNVVYRVLFDSLVTYRDPLVDIEVDSWSLVIDFLLCWEYSVPGHLSWVIHMVWALLEERRLLNSDPIVFDKLLLE